MIVRDCRDAQRALDVHADGELPPADALEMERHLEDCASCAAHASFTRMMKRAVRHEARAEGASSSLRDRILASARAWEDEQARVEVEPVEEAAPIEPAIEHRPVVDELARRRVRATGWQRVAPWAAAAAVAIGIGSALMGGGVQRGGPTHVSTVDVAAKADLLSGAASHAMLLDEFAAYHARPLPPEQMDPMVINSVFSPIVGVPVHAARFGQGLPQPPQFSGARLMRVHNEAAATLTYNVAGKRVTVFVFDPTRIHIRSACCLEPRTVRSSPSSEPRTIFIGRAKGYPLAAFERDGVGYALSADLRDDDVLELATRL